VVRFFRIGVAVAAFFKIGVAISAVLSSCTQPYESGTHLSNDLDATAITGDSPLEMHRKSLLAMTYLNHTLSILQTLSRRKATRAGLRPQFSCFAPLSVPRRIQGERAKLTFVQPVVIVPEVPSLRRPRTLLDAGKHLRMSRNRLKVSAHSTRQRIGRDSGGHETQSRSEEPPLCAANS
jgi:hypothetical protein